MALKIRNVGNFSNIRMGEGLPSVTPITYPIGINIMTTEYFTALDSKSMTITPETNIEPSEAYLTDYITDANRDYDHFLTGEFWGIPQNNSLIFRLTQGEEVDTVSMTFGNTSGMPNSVRILTWDGSTWNDVGGTSSVITNTNVSFTTVAHNSETFKIEFTNGDLNYYIDSNSLVVKLR